MTADTTRSIAESLEAASAPTAHELLQRARALGPVLRERIAAGEEGRMLPRATLEDFQSSGFFRMLQPARFGGFEVEPRAFFDVQMAIAEVCPSSAWVMGVVGVHNWQLALFAPRAQDEVWGRDRSVLISSSYAPTGNVVRAPGGYRISGRWSFSSGCDHCQWAFLGGFVPGPVPGLVPDAGDGEPSKGPDMRTFLVPRGDYRIDDTWHVAGLKATGSKDIVVEDAFVPEHRTHRLVDGYKRQSPGNAVNTAPLYRIPFGQIFVRSVSTSAIGAAQGALDAYCDLASKRVAAGDGARVAEDPRAQSVAAHAAAAIDEARLTLHRNFDEMMSAARTSTELPIARRARFRFDSANSVVKCVDAVDGLFTASGGRAIFTKSPMLRYFLDVHAARAHYANNPDKPARNFGGMQLQLKNQDYFL